MIWHLLKRTGKRFQAHDMTDRAAALTYYAILSIFPALIALVSVVGLLGGSAVETLLDNVEAVTPGPAKEIFTTAVRSLQESQGRAGVFFVLGTLGALWSASGYVAAFMRAANAIHGVGEERPIYKTLPVRIGTTIVLMLLLMATALGVALTGDLAGELGGVLGVGDIALTLWGYLKWPVLIVLVSFMFAFLYWIAPSVERRTFRLLSPGGVFGVVIWLAASALFAIYVANFGSYEKTYGTLGGAVTFLVWLWISNAALLLGGELNAELERSDDDTFG